MFIIRLNIVPDKILHKELSYKINGICFTIHKELGRYYREKQYSDSLENI